MTKIERGERYGVGTYGEVQVTDLSEKIQSVSENGAIEKDVLVQFVVDPDSAFTTDRDIKQLTVEKFIAALSSDYSDCHK